MNLTTIKVASVNDEPKRVVIKDDKDEKYNFFKTGWDKVKGGPSVLDSEPYAQFKTMRIAIGDELTLDVYEKEKEFEGKKYMDRKINRFLGLNDGQKGTGSEEVPF